jgi:hypothetical protein
MSATLPSRTVAAKLGCACDIRLLENLGRRCGLAWLGCLVVALRGPGGRGSVTACRPFGEGRAYFDKKLAEGKTRKEALRALKRQVSDAVFARLRADARRARAQAGDPGGQ